MYILEITQDLHLGHLGFKFKFGHKVADVLGESFVILSFYPGRCNRLPPLFPALWFCSTVTANVGRGSLSPFSKPDGKKPFFFPPPTNISTYVSKRFSRRFSEAKWVTA